MSTEVPEYDYRSQWAEEAGQGTDGEQLDAVDASGNPTDPPRKKERKKINAWHVQLKERKDREKKDRLHACQQIPLDLGCTAEAWSRTCSLPDCGRCCAPQCHRQCGVMALAPLDALGLVRLPERGEPAAGLRAAGPGVMLALCLTPSGSTPCGSTQFQQGNQLPACGDRLLVLLPSAVLTCDLRRHCRAPTSGKSQPVRRTLPPQSPESRGTQPLTPGRRPRLRLGLPAEWQRCVRRLRSQDSPPQTPSGHAAPLRAH